MWKSKVWNGFGVKSFGAITLVMGFSFLSSFSFAPYQYSYLAFFSLIPLFYFIQKTAKLRSAWLYGFLAGFSFFFFHFRWLSVFGLLPWMALVVYQSFFWGLACYFIKVALERNVNWLPPFLWVGVEFLRSSGPAGFGWGLLGLGQTNSFLSFLFPIFGVWGASFLLASFNFLISRLLLRDRMGWFSLLIGLLALLAFLFRPLDCNSQPVFRPENFLKAVLVQTAIPQREKLSGEAESLFFKIVAEIEKKDLKKDSLVIFPETAYPNILSVNSEVKRRLSQLAKEKKCWILTGAFRRNGAKTYNSAFLFSPDGKLRVYDKFRLVPFGEFWPFRPYLNWLPYASLIKVDLSAGLDPQPLSFQDSKLGVAICFESSDSFLIRGLVRKGAKILVFITNDSWFDGTEALAQHFQIAQVRAAENGRVVLQVANTGCTGVISEKGKVIAQARLAKPVFLAEYVAFPKSEETFFNRFGYLFPLFSFFLTLFFLISQLYFFFPLRF